MISPSTKIGDLLSREAGCTTVNVTLNPDETITVTMQGRAYRGRDLEDAVAEVMRSHGKNVPPDWMHVSGKGPYRIVCIADVAPDATEEPTVVYQGPDGKFWTRKLSNFQERMQRVTSA
jgi:hypothetical protein